MNLSRERERESRQNSSAEDEPTRSRLSYGIGGGGFIQRGTGKHQSNEVFDRKDETSRTLTSSDYKSPIKIVESN